MISIIILFLQILYIKEIIFFALCILSAVSNLDMEDVDLVILLHS